MNPIIRNILAVLAGLVVGSVVNMALVKLGGALIPVPGDVDVSDPESIKANLHLFGPQHYIFPFIAHALGTLAGAFTAAKIAVSHKIRYAFGIGVLFLLGGLMAAYMIPAPTWFVIVDLLLAYIPMAGLAGLWVNKNQKSAI